PVRGGSEYQHLTDLNSLMESVSLSHSCDRWICDLSGDGEFRVKEVRNFLDNLFLPSYADATRWVKYIPIKINVFVWCARRDFLPTRVNLSRREEKPVRIIPGPAGIVQAAKLCKQADIQEGRDKSVLSTQEYIRKAVEDVGEDEDFKGESWVSVVEFVNANEGIVNGCLGNIKNYFKNGKLEQVVAIINSCTADALGNLTMTHKDLSSSISGTIHYKVINEE
nr:hypothetical protein [Tanacetum cinerariifolium]